LRTCLKMSFPISRVKQMEMQGCESSAHVIRIRIKTSTRSRYRKSSLFTQTKSSESCGSGGDKPIIINIMSDKGGATAPILYADNINVGP